MGDRSYNLALETSGPMGSVTLGRNGQELQTATLPPQQRHTLDLMPVIDQVFRGFREQAITPGDLGEVYVSIGPGSFTGLRIGVTTAKMLAQVLGVKIVAVPTLEVVAQNAPAPPPGAGAGAGDEQTRLAVCLNVKNDTAYTGLFRWDGQAWQPEGPPMLATMPELLGKAPRPLKILGDPLPAWSEPLPAGVSVLPVELAVPRSKVVWRLGRIAAGRGQFTEALALLPLYARRPEAEELWEKRHPEENARQAAVSPAPAQQTSG